MKEKWNREIKKIETVSLEEQEKYVEEVAAAVKAANGYIDNHNDRFVDLDKENVEIMKFYRYNKARNGRYVKAEVDIVPVYKGTLNCLNPIELAPNGKAHLSTWSIGGNVVRGDIETFNREHSVKWLKEQGYTVMSCYLGRLERIA